MSLFPLIDVHAHLADPIFDADRDAVLERAGAAGILRIVVVGESLADARRILDLAGEYPQIAPAIGLYPTNLDSRELEQILQFISAQGDRLTAIGEIGLDHWVVQDPAAQERQRDFFLRQVAMAVDLDLPINVHSRSAGRATIEVLKAARARRVLMHAFDGRAGTAQAGLDAGFYFSIPPSIVRSRQKQKLARYLPLDRLLLETDSPVLGPDPGARNEPAYLTMGLKALAGIKGLSSERVAEQTTLNAIHLFHFEDLLCKLPF